MDEKQKKEVKNKLSLSLLLLLIAIISLTATTAAWFSVADNAQITSMNLQITSGANMRFDLDRHTDFADYVKTLTFSEISARILQDEGYNMQEVPLEPLTTSDCSTYTFENGKVSAETDGAYVTFTLHFMATEDMVVHLTPTEGENGEAGTAITSDTAGLVESMRISFTADGKNYIYDPGIGATSTENGNNKTFGLPTAANMVYNDTNALFSLKEGVDKTVVVHIWIEGTDETCTNDLQGSDYSIMLRFQGTDDSGNVLEGAKRGENVKHASGDASEEYYTQRSDTADEAQEETEDDRTWVQKVVDFFTDLFNTVTDSDSSESGDSTE